MALTRITQRIAPRPDGLAAAIVAGWPLARVAAGGATAILAYTLIRWNDQVVLGIALMILSLIGIAQSARAAVFALRAGNAPREPRSVACFVGTDGVSFEHEGRARFVAWPTIGGVERRGESVTFQVSPDERVSLVVDAPEVLERLLRERGGRTRGVEPLPEALARGDESIRAWLARVRGLLTAGDYRSSPVSPETLAGIAEDGCERPLVRVAAALALGHAKSELAGRAREAADDTVQADLRAALAEAAEGRVDEPRVAALAVAATRGSS